MRMSACMMVLAGALIGAPTLAQAGSAPAQACKGAPQVGEAVLGHFRGGRVVLVENEAPYLVWQDNYTCFSSMRSCQRWQRDMQAVYRNVEGDRTCLPLR